MRTGNPDAVEVFFDYTCPFTYRAQRWLDSLMTSITGRPLPAGQPGKNAPTCSDDKQKNDLAL
jgi:predicted DsbA family dithiol-disulfide isomerase